ncbi:hypothetical protein UF75_5188 [Desulfosporosinus sp. I2]|nr:hypothetical protein UF75_5188 [Desulfosporosinus sp. I2]
MIDSRMFDFDKAAGQTEGVSGPICAVWVPFGAEIKPF